MSRTPHLQSEQAVLCSRLSFILSSAIGIGLEPSSDMAKPTVQLLFGHTERTIRYLAIDVDDAFSIAGK